MEFDSPIFVAGHHGLVGSAITRRLRALGYKNLILRRHSELDLMDQRAVSEFFVKERPEYVFLAAAKVGGILANNSYPAEFIYSNLMIQTNVIHESWRAGVKRLLFLGSSCIYPRDCPQPMSEDYLMTGKLEVTNRPYAVAKIAGIEQCWSYNRQHGTNFLAAMPTNLYGPGDSYDLQNSHVLPALIRKVHEAKCNGSAEFSVWGTGQPMREFLYSDDMANAVVFLINLDEERFQKFLKIDSPPLINVGSGKEISIRDLASLVAEIVDYSGRVVFGASDQDGTPRKLLNSSRLLSLGWRPNINLREGVAFSYADFKTRLSQAPA